MLQLDLLVGASICLWVSRLTSCQFLVISKLCAHLYPAFSTRVCFFSMLENNPGYTILYAFYQSYTPFIDFLVITDWFPGVKVSGAGAIQTGYHGSLGLWTYLRALKFRGPNKVWVHLFSSTIIPEATLVGRLNRAKAQGRLHKVQK